MPLPLVEPTIGYNLLRKVPTHSTNSGECSVLHIEGAQQIWFIQIKQLRMLHLWSHF